MNSFMMLLSEAATEPSGLEQVAEDTKEQVNQLIQMWKAVEPGVISFGKRLIAAVLIFVIGRIIIKMMLKICNKFFSRANIEISVSKFMMSVIRALLYLMLIIMVCSKLGIETSSFIAIIGSAGLAVGLAIQGSLSNFAGGVLLLLVKPFKVGDYVIDSGSGNEGTVTKIDLFYTNILTVDNKKIVIPNGTLANNTLVNVTAMEKRRVDFEIGISYDSDIGKAKEVIAEVAGKHELVLKEEEIFVFVSSLDASQVTMGLRVWTETSNYWTVKFDLNEAIKKALDENEIEIPFNQVQIHVSKGE